MWVSEKDPRLRDELDAGEVLGKAELVGCDAGAKEAKDLRAQGLREDLQRFRR